VVEAMARETRTLSTQRASRAMRPAPRARVRYRTLRKASRPIWKRAEPIPKVSSSKRSSAGFKPPTITWETAHATAPMLRSIP
jgi:hypothetical protein